MKIEVPNEIRSNRVDDLFRPCWIVKTLRSDRVGLENEQGWITLVVFEDDREMEALIAGWKDPQQEKRVVGFRPDVMGSAR